MNKSEPIEAINVKSSLTETITKLKEVQSDLQHPEKISEILSEFNFEMLSFIYEINTTAKNIIVRSRNNCMKSEINSTKDISYLDENKCLKYQRASIPMKSCFYGSFTVADIDEAIKIEKEYIDYYKFLAKKTAISSLLESGDFMCITNRATTKHAVCGIFNVIRPLRLLAIPSPESINNNSGLFKYFSNNYNNIYNQYDYSVNIDNMKKFSAFLYDQFNKNCTSEEDYMIPAMLADSIMSIDEIDGIIYESVQSKSKSIICETLNIALKPKSADKKLSLSYCLEYKLHETDNKPIILEPLEFSIPLTRTNK